MIKESKVLKSFDIICDFCKVTQKVMAYEKPSLPKNWGYYTSYCGDHYCGGHSNELCPGCLKKYGTHEKY
jgi:hypothetical protein